MSEPKQLHGVAFWATVMVLLPVVHFLRSGGPASGTVCWAG
jgi:hypothetical protein